MDIETEIQDLKRRVGDLEGAVNVLTGQLLQVHPELVALNSQTKSRFDGIESSMERVVERLDTINSQVWSLRDDIPDLLKEILRRSRGQ